MSHTAHPLRIRCESDTLDPIDWHVVYDLNAVRFDAVIAVVQNLDTTWEDFAVALVYQDGRRGWRLLGRFKDPDRPDYLWRAFAVFSPVPL